jgi:hypothetical protein
MVKSNKKGGGNPNWRKGAVSPNPQGGKLAGRNAANRTIKAKLTRFVARNATPRALQTMYDKLKVKDKLTFLVEVLPYVTAKHTSLTVGTPFDDLSDNDLDKMLTKILSPAQSANALQEPIQTQPGQVLFLNSPILKENGTNGQNQEDSSIDSNTNG